MSAFIVRRSTPLATRSRARAGSFAALPFGQYRPRPRRSTIPVEVVDVSQDDLMAIGRRLDDLIPTSADPRDVLADLVREHGPERTAQEARIVFGSWRTRIDLVEGALQEVLAQERGS